MNNTGTPSDGGVGCQTGSLTQGKKADIHHPRRHQDHVAEPGDILTREPQENVTFAGLTGSVLGLCLRQSRFERYSQSQSVLVLSVI
jgi:hypothetical protein